MVTEIQFLTKNPGNLYVCGDCRRGASLVVTAIAEGRDCAARVDAGLLLRDLNPVTIKRNHILYTVVPYYIMLT